MFVSLQLIYDEGWFFMQAHHCYSAGALRLRTCFTIWEINLSRMDLLVHVIVRCQCRAEAHCEKGYRFLLGQLTCCNVFYLPARNKLCQSCFHFWFSLSLRLLGINSLYVTTYFHIRVLLVVAFCISLVWLAGSVGDDTETIQLLTHSQ